MEVVQTDEVGDVGDCLRYIEKRVKQDKLYAAGFITYEAAPAFDKALTVLTGNELPLVWFGLYYDKKHIVQSHGVGSDYFTGEWSPTVSHMEYGRAISKIKDYIVAGDTYQVNYTFRLRADFAGDPRQLFFNLQEVQQAEYAAFVDIGSHAICSISPELFFELEDQCLVSKPMKGTCPRGKTLEQDRVFSHALFCSEKNRAENIMIVDMVRNDMGKIAEIGSVQVKRHFEIEKHPYVFQMTTTVESKTEGSFFKVMQALFPCASITGAPKVRSMQIINELESTPRGVYTGCIGYLTPNGQARFNVAIRTITINKSSCMAEYGVGGGIVWDSEMEEEYRECLTKAEIIYRKPEMFNLFESMLWQPEKGFYLLENHLDRLRDSAEYYAFKLDLEQIKKMLENYKPDNTGEGAKVRLIVDKAGNATIDSQPLIGVKSNNLKICLARNAVDVENTFLYHKTTQRQVYENAIKECPDYDDVILWNERKEITESTRANVVVLMNGRKITPPIECGLLAGTFRRHLLESRDIEEGIISVDEIKRAEQIFLINSVRGWMEAHLG